MMMLRRRYEWLNDYLEGFGIKYVGDIGGFLLSSFRELFNNPFPKGDKVCEKLA